MHAVGVARLVSLAEALQLLFGLFDGVGVEQLAQVGVAQEFAELVLIDGERLGAAFGERSVAVVDEVGDVAEEQRRGEGRRRARVDGVDAELRLLDAAQRLRSARACRRHRAGTRGRPQAGWGRTGSGEATLSRS